jgi:hypothetical protein
MNVASLETEIGEQLFHNLKRELHLLTVEK